MEHQGSGDEFTLHTVRDLHELQTLRECWKSWQTGRDSDIDFFSGVVRSRGNACRPNVLVLLRKGKPDALLVGLRDRRGIPLRIGSVTLLQPEVNVLQFVRGGLLGNASIENCRALVQAVMKSLAQGDADLALWEHLDERSALYLNAVQLPGVAMRDHCRKVREHWFLPQPKGLEAFLQSLGRSQRSKLRRKYNKFTKGFEGKFQVRSFRTPAELSMAIHDMEEIARNSVKRQLGFGFFNTTQSRKQLLVEAQQGWLRIYILYVEGKPVAFWKGTLYGNCLQSDHVGFDSSWSEFSPGIVLFLNVIDSCRESQVEVIDFGTGNGQLYECFARLRRCEARAQIFAPRFTGLKLNLLQTLTHYTTLLIQGASWLDWARRAVWKVRKAVLERVSTQRCESEPVNPRGTVL
jgi:Acetyltransferase (GNAT) domain